MIYIDTREGGPQQLTAVSRLITQFTQHRFHPPVTAHLLPAADFMFTGSGPLGTASIGLERKRIHSQDFFRSIFTGRLIDEQLPKLIDHYDFCYLIVEGQARVDPITGYLEEYMGRERGWVRIGEGNSKCPYTGEQLLGMMNSIALFTGIKLVRTFNERDTVDVISTLWHWWQKEWDKHGTHRAIHTPQTTVTIGKASTTRRIAAQLPGVGWEKSGTIAHYFHSVADMVKAEKEDWEKLPGFGKKLSERVMAALKGEYCDV